MITATQIITLRKSLNFSQAEFGLILKRAIDPKAARGYSRQYIDRLEKGKDVVTPKLEKAFWSIAAAADDADPAAAIAKNVEVQP